MINNSMELLNSYKVFGDFPSAFDYCREANHPVRVIITGNMAWKLYTLYPSGRADYIRVVPKGTGGVNDG